MQSVSRIPFVLLAIALLSMSVEAGAQDPPPLKQQVDTLIQKLDSASFAERERAFAQLKELGKPVVPFLSEARKTVASPEVRARLDSILRLRFHPAGPSTVLRGHTDWIMGVDFAPDGSRLVSVSRDRTLRMWDLTAKKSIYQSPPVQTPLETAIFTPDGKQMVVCGGNLRGGLNELKLCNAANGETVRSFVGHKGRVNRVRLSPDGKLLASSGIDKTIQVWDVSTGKNLISIRGHAHHAYGVSFHPDGKRLASCGRDNTVRLWDVELGKRIQLFKGHTEQVIDVEFSPDGKHLASACDDKTIRFWDVTTGKELRRFLGHAHDIRDLCFSPDSRLLASASYDQTVKVWEVSTGTCIATLKHNNVARTVTFSPDGKQVATACGDHTICLWDISTFIEANTDVDAQHNTKDFGFKTGTLICVQGRKHGAGSVTLYQGERFIWSIGGLSNPRSAEQLPNGNVLISEYGYEPRPEELQITERTPDNRIVWKHVAYEPIACFRLKDGRTVVAAERSVYIVGPDGNKTKELYSRPRNLVRGAGLLPDGTLGFFQTASGPSLFVEIDLEGNVKRETEIESDGMGAFAALPNGHLLLPMTFRNKVVELDANRRPVGVFAEIKQPCDVQRLPGGNIAVATWKSGIATFDSKGNKLEVQSFGEINAARIYSPVRFKIKSTSATPKFESLKKAPGLALQYLKELGATVVNDGAKGEATEVDLYSYYAPYSLVNDHSLRLISLFPSLEKVNLGNTKISDQGLMHLKTLVNLKELNLDRTGITDRGLLALAPIHSLNRVSLVDVPIGDEGLKALVKSNSHLEYVNLAGTRVSDTGLAILTDLKNLKKVTLPNDSSDEGLWGIANITSLETVAANGARLTANGIKALTNLENLKSLELEKARLTDEAMDAMITLSGLRRLNLAGSQTLTPAGLNKLSQLRKLRILNLDNCQVNDEVLAHIATLGYLEEIFLQGTSVTDKGLEHLGNTITLKQLYLYNTAVSARAIKNLTLYELPYCRVVIRHPG